MKKIIAMCALYCGVTLLVPPLHAEDIPQQKQKKFVLALSEQNHDKFVKKICELDDKAEGSYNETVGAIIDVSNQLGLQVKSLDGLNDILSEFGEYISVYTLHKSTNRAAISLSELISKEAKTIKVDGKDMAFYSTRIRNDKTIKMGTVGFSTTAFFYNRNSNEVVHEVDVYTELAERLWGDLQNKDYKHMSPEYNMALPFLNKQWGNDIEQLLESSGDIDEAKQRFTDLTIKQFIEDIDCRAAYLIAYGEKNQYRSLNARLFQYMNGPLCNLNILYDCGLAVAIGKNEEPTDWMREEGKIASEIINEFITAIRLQQRKGEYKQISSINELDAPLERQIADLSKLSRDDVRKLAAMLYVGEVK